MYHLQDSHRVSAKIAIYSDDAERVLVMSYPRRDVFGLPGGHVDAGEDPDTALQRELQEELGITLPAAKRADFFMSNRIILGYTATVPADFQTHPSNHDKEHAIWVSKAEFEQMTAINESYTRFVLEQWPSK